ncbi:hypothetical protein BDQ12DRAFT_12529 [Crucibulum laeve]|uniref:Uncharacterized protein n=1 Tax=Crucibulum laeve TaxID=68775 RepID=A0A5C3MG16_9AGAR|nr:hypothetical protein BDQ12DRAFT_12529 [Crucibulum laeve]
MWGIGASEVLCGMRRMCASLCVVCINLRGQCAGSGYVVCARAIMVMVNVLHRSTVLPLPTCDGQTSRRLLCSVFSNPCLHLHLLSIHFLNLRPAISRPVIPSPSSILQHTPTTFYPTFCIPQAGAVDPSPSLHCPFSLSNDVAS